MSSLDGQKEELYGFDLQGEAVRGPFRVEATLVGHLDRDRGERMVLARDQVDFFVTSEYLEEVRSGLNSKQPPPQSSEHPWECTYDDTASPNVMDALAVH